MDTRNDEAFIAMEGELDSYYSSFDPHTDELLCQLKEMEAASRSASPLERKCRMHEMMSEQCEVHVFRTFPFYFEMSSGRGRFSWGGLDSPVGTFYHQLNADQWLTPYAEATEEDRAEGFLHGWNNPVGIDHHCPNYDAILAGGLTGIIERARRRLAHCSDPAKREFYGAVIRSNQALIRIARRFAEAAVAACRAEQDPQCLRNLRRIAETAARVPANPPETFYEALETILFIRECVGSLEGIGISTFGQLDRLLGPYYERDLAAGRITRGEAKMLLRSLLLYTDVRFDMLSQQRETSTTIVLGGCDRDGCVVFNEVTRMLLEAEMEGRYIGTKFNGRISRRHPAEFLSLLSRVLLCNLPVLVFQNDEILVAARVKRGQALEDSRLYVSGGCHEVVSANTEVCTRADTWINLPRLLLHTLCSQNDFACFDDLYQCFLQDVRDYHDRIASLKNEGERRWREFNPLPLYSSSIEDCLEKGMDVTEGGARYSATALSMLGAASLVDSLYSIKAFVYDQRLLSLPRLKQILRDDFEHEEAFRQLCINRLPKHGSHDETVDAFSARVLHDLSNVSGQVNGRGGPCYPAFYAPDMFRELGARTPATPDGRKAGTYLSRGVSPSEFVQVDSPLSIIQSLQAIDFTDYVDSFVTEITLPRMDESEGIPVLLGLVRGFLAAGGSSLQFNLLDPQMLRDAQLHPDNHRDLIVRICGYSEVFVNLAPALQEEVMSRALR